MTAIPHAFSVPAVLTFEGTELHIVDRDGRPWVTATDLARALGYSRADAATKIFDRSADEFTPDMTLTPNLGVKGFGAGNSAKPVRIFSPRGCHLVAMLAKTERAKAFRKWVLDVLEKSAPPPAAPAEGPRAVSAAIRETAERLGLTVAMVRGRLCGRFYTARVRDLTPHQRALAVEWLGSMDHASEIRRRPGRPTLSPTAPLVRLELGRVTLPAPIAARICDLITKHVA